MLPTNALIVLSFSTVGLVFACREIAHRFSYADEKPAAAEIELAPPPEQPVTPSARGLGKLHPQFRIDRCARKPMTHVDGAHMSNRVMSQRAGCGNPARWSRDRFTIALKRPASS